MGLYGSIPLLLYSVYTTWASSLNLFSSLIVDRFGRIRLLLIGFCGCICMLICFTAMVATFSGSTNRVGNGFGVLFLFLFVTFYASCIDAVSYIYCSEIFPTNTRAQGFAASIFGLFAMTLSEYPFEIYQQAHRSLTQDLVYTEPASTAFANIGWKYYLVFIIVPAVGLPLIWRFPETKGLTLEEIAALFGDKVALDLSHLTVEEKMKLDAEIRAQDGKMAIDMQDSDELKNTRVECTESLA